MQGNHPTAEAKEAAAQAQIATAHLCRFLTLTRPRFRPSTLTTGKQNSYNAACTAPHLGGVSCIRGRIQRPSILDPRRCPIDTPSRLAILTLVAPALALAVWWSIGMWRRALIARSEHLARRAVELERRLRDAHGELGQWERRATSAASALTDVSAALPWDTVTAERRIARLADDLREALAENTARELRVIPSSRSTPPPRSSWRPAVVPQERSA